jgi:ABC-type branched-subunit amino acid transport system ATPase component
MSSASAARTDVLETSDLRVHFEGVKAIDGVDLVLTRNEVLGLIGPNGAGKTTLVNALTGSQKPTGGKVSLDGTEVTGWAAHRLARRGLARTFQNVRLFRRLTALENVEAGAVGVGMGRREARRWAATVMEQLGFYEKADVEAGALPQGLERRLGIARALATKPKFLLLDEPAAGLNEAESSDLATRLGEIRENFSCGVLIIEHDMNVIMSVCDRIQVLDYGKTISIGTPAEVRRDRAVIAAYLGTAKELDAASN